MQRMKPVEYKEKKMMNHFIILNWGRTSRLRLKVWKPKINSNLQKIQKLLENQPTKQKHGQNQETLISWSEEKVYL